MKHDPNMITNPMIIILYKDWHIEMCAVAVSTLNYCRTTAWDKQTGKIYFLLDMPGIE